MRGMSLRNLAFAILTIGVASCSQDAAGPPAGGTPEATSPMYVSNPISNALLNVSTSGASTTLTNINGARSTAAIMDDANVAYISLRPQTYPAGASARISNLRSGATVTTPMVDGGLDPVPLPASAGDGVSIEVETVAGVTIGPVNSFSLFSTL
jgi:hypothetical protein